MARRNFSRIGKPISFRAEPTVHGYLQKLSNMSDFINDTLKEKIAKKKKPLEIYRDHKKEMRRVVKKLNRLQQNIEMLEDQLSQEELELTQSIVEEEMLSKEVQKEDLANYISDGPS